MSHSFLYARQNTGLLWHTAVCPSIHTSYDNISHVTNQISEIKLCENEVEDVLKVINPTKASAPDLINPRLLQEAAPIINIVIQ
jgi:hypothetical protein